MSIAINNEVKNLESKLGPIYVPGHGGYKWRNIQGWTGSPEYVRWFEEKPENGLDDMISFSIAAEDPKTLESVWTSVSAYREDAIELRPYLESGQSVFLKVGGCLKTSKCGNYENLQAKKLIVYTNSLNRTAATPEVQAAAQANEPVPEFSGSPKDYAEADTDAPF